jgi:hypothetical protein
MTALMSFSEMLLASSMSKTEAGRTSQIESRPSRISSASQ